jgi:hypothetical protein
LLAVALAAGFYRTFDAKLASQRQEPLDKVQKMLRSMRLQGLEEDALRQFVCKYSGEHWEEFYEALFGYEAKLAAREKWGQGDRGTGRAKFAAWRDPLVRWIEARQIARREAKERRHLQAVEEKSLKAAGVDAAQARKQAEKAATKLISQAKSKRTGLARTLVIAPVKGPLELVLGAKTRFILGAAIMLGCVWWIKQNELVGTQELEQVAAQVQDGAQGDALATQSKKIAGSILERLKNAKPLELAAVPDSITGPVSHFTAGIAGFLLIASAVCTSRLKVFVLWIAAVALFVVGLSLPW